MFRPNKGIIEITPVDEQDIADIHAYRRDRASLAIAGRENFERFDPSIPGAKVTAVVREIDDEYWVYITAEGELVPDDVPILPDYERVT